MKRTLVPLLLTLAAPAVAHADIASNAERWQPQAGDVIAFDVLRKGNPFGSHEVRFSQTDDGALKVDVDVDLKAGLGPITLFRYELDAMEVWQDGRLMELRGEVNDDGDYADMVARRMGDALKIDGDAKSGTVEGDIIPASHWNIEQMEQSRLLSSEDGELIEVSVKEIGRETLTIDDQQIPARKFLMDGEIDVTLWYDDTGRWLKLAFEARGQQIEYSLRELY